MKAVPANNLATYAAQWTRYPLLNGLPSTALNPSFPFTDDAMM